MTERTRLPLPEPIGVARIFEPWMVDPKVSKGFYRRASVYTADQMHAYSDAENAALREQVRVLREALQEVLEFQSAPTQPTIHDYGRWRRAALEATK